MTVDASAVARVLGITTTFKDLLGAGALNLPQRIAVFAQGRSDVVYSADKFQATSSKQVGDTLGYGSPANLVARELFPDNGDGVGTIPVTFYPLTDDYTDIQANGRVTPSGTQTKAAAYQLRIGGVLSESFTIPAGATVAAIADLITTAVNAVLHMPVEAQDFTTHVRFVAKWAGTSGNDITIQVIGESLGTVFTIVQPTGGTSNPTVDAALLQVGDIWETLGLNALNPGDTASLDAFDVFGEGRWGTLTHKPWIVFFGNNEPVVATATAGTTTRNLDRTNCQLVAPGSTNLPCVIAARELARIAVLANNDPPHDYGSQRATGLNPGTDAQQWDYADRDLAVKAGSSTVEVKDGVVNLSDTVTPYLPVGEANPAYRYVVDIIKLMQLIFNMELEFATTEWDGAPLIPDNQATTNPSVKKPKMAIAAANRIIDALALQAVLSDPTTAKKQTTAVIDSGNPKRLNLRTKVQLSGNANIIDVDQEWSFFFGTAAVVG